MKKYIIYSGYTLQTDIFWPYQFIESTSILNNNDRIYLLVDENWMEIEKHTLKINLYVIDDNGNKLINEI